MFPHVFISPERIRAESVTYLSACQVAASNCHRVRLAVFNLPAILSLDYASGDISEDLSSLGIVSFGFVTLFNCHEQTVVQEAVSNEEV